MARRKINFICAVPDCTTAAITRGLCKRHYTRVWRRGCVTLPSAHERFLTNVDRSGGSDACWPWTRFRNPDGYGKVRVNGEVMAHRTAWIIANGPIPNGLFVLHSCDNPPCCNPAHLFLGTKADNTADAVSKGNQWELPVRRGEEQWNAKLTTADIVAIRDQHAAGITGNALARAWNVDATAISKIVRRKNWKHVP